MTVTRCRHAEGRDLLLSNAPCVKDEIGHGAAGAARLDR